MSINQAGKLASKTITLSTSDPADKSMSFYKSWFGSNGWKVLSENSMGVMSSVSAQKGDLTATVMAMSGAKNLLTITIASSK